MAVGNIHKADTACYEINSMVCGHRTHISVRLAAIREQLYLEKETGNPDNDIAMTTVIDDY